MEHQRSNEGQALCLPIPIERKSAGLVGVFRVRLRFDPPGQSLGLWSAAIGTVPFPILAAVTIFGCGVDSRARGTRRCVWPELRAVRSRRPGIGAPVATTSRAILLARRLRVPRSGCATGRFRLPSFQRTAAGKAANGVGEPALREERLFTRREYKGLAAVAARNRFVSYGHGRCCCVWRRKPQCERVGR
jgi:hypothetical protein